MTDVVVTKVESAEVDHALGTFADQLGDTRPLHNAWAEDTHEQVLYTINTGNEGTYPELKPSTVKQKERAGQGSNPILVATGTMLRVATSSNEPDSIFESEPDHLDQGLKGRSGQIAAYHQGGTDKMAARPLYTNLDRLKGKLAERSAKLLGVEISDLGLTVISR